MYYHLRSTMKRECFFVHVYFSNETVTQTTVSTGPMKMFCLEHETMNVCQRNVARFADVEYRFDKIKDMFQGFGSLGRVRLGIFRNKNVFRNIFWLFCSWGQNSQNGIQVFRNENSSQTNAYLHYSNYSYSGLIPNERALSFYCNFRKMEVRKVNKFGQTYRTRTQVAKGLVVRSYFSSIFMRRSVREM